MKKYISCLPKRKRKWDTRLRECDACYLRQVLSEKTVMPAKAGIPFNLFLLAFLTTTMLIGTPICAMEQTSLFFTPDERQAIENPPLKLESTVAVNRRDINLDAVFYYSPGNWTLWMQNEKWTPETRKPELEVVDVTPDEVRLVIAIPDQPLRKVTLKPHQTYRVASGDVVEGVPASPEASSPSR